MTTADIAGAVILAIPAYLAAWLLLRKQPVSTFYAAAALLAAGIGYLTFAGVSAEVTTRFMTMIDAPAGALQRMLS